MNPKYTPLTPQLYGYLLEHGHNRDPVLEDLARENEQLGPISLMQVAPEQGTLLHLLARAIGARRALEVGTFTGYSAICIARALPADGRLICCDVNPDWAAIARRYFERAGVAERIELRLAPAIETIRALPSEPHLDFAFVDADKVSYPLYYEEIVPRLRPNGLLLLDNVFWLGQVTNPDDQSAEARAIREVNDRIVADRRVQAVMLAVSDGLTIVRRKESGEG